VIKATNIHKSFGDLKVLKGVDLSVGKGEIVSIVGVSGAGKTTLLQLLGTLDRPDAGSIELNGTSVDGMGQRELAAFRNKHIGFVFQFHQLLPEFTALENVCMPGFIAKHSRGVVEKEATRILSDMGLADRMEHKPSTLSGGEQQRVSVARAMINSPNVILADEPSGNLDSQNADELHNLFFDLREKTGQTFVIVTHNEALANMADRKLTIKDGRIDRS
jgi:lipoprotein-releasing system ATP-binding protein